MHQEGQLGDKSPPHLCPWNLREQKHMGHHFHDFVPPYGYESLNCDDGADGIAWPAWVTWWWLPIYCLMTGLHIIPLRLMSLLWTWKVMMPEQHVPVDILYIVPMNFYRCQENDDTYYTIVPLVICSDVEANFLDLPSTPPKMKPNSSPSESIIKHAPSTWRFSSTLLTIFLQPVLNACMTRLGRLQWSLGNHVEFSAVSVSSCGAEICIFIGMHCQGHQVQIF